MDDDKYPSLCQVCVWVIHPMMLTGYCLWNTKCTCCGRICDLAMCKLDREDQAAAFNKRKSNDPKVVYLD